MEDLEFERNNWLLLLALQNPREGPSPQDPSRETHAISGFCQVSSQDRLEVTVPALANERENKSAETCPRGFLTNRNVCLVHSLFSSPMTECVIKNSGYR